MSLGTFRPKRGRAYPRVPVQRGNWHAGESYEPGDIVTVMAAGRYVCITAHTAGEDPPNTIEGAIHWQRYIGELG